MPNVLSQNYMPNSNFNSYSPNNNNLSILRLEFTQDELEAYTTWQKVGLSKATIPWINKASQTLWNNTEGEISKASLETLRDYVLTKYTDICAKRKVLNFAKAFLRYVAKIRFDTRYKEFDFFLEMSKAVKESKRITQRIVIIEDVKAVLAAIEKGHENREFTTRQYQNYKALEDVNLSPPSHCITPRMPHTTMPPSLPARYVGHRL